VLPLKTGRLSGGESKARVDLKCFEEGSAKMKDQIVQAIYAEFESLGLSPMRDKESDIVVDKELLDAKVSSGEKKIRYENAILVDDHDKAIYMYEKTTEQSKGFGFGSGSESTFQSGKTLSRHVKGTYVGLNGASVTYDLDIGEISKTAKQIAEKNGYKFKTVIRRKSAQMH
jgi:hypothetical protein